MLKMLSKLLVSTATAAARTATKTRAIDPTTKKLVQGPHFVPSFSSSASFRGSKKSKKMCPGVSQHVLRRLKEAATKKDPTEPASHENDHSKDVTRELFSILGVDRDADAPPSSDHNNEMQPWEILDFHWDSNNSQDCMIPLKKDISRDRKQRYRRFIKQRYSAHNLGTTELIKDVNPQSCFRISYYEMLLSIKLGDEDKIHALCNSLAVASGEESYKLAGDYKQGNGVDGTSAS